MTEPVMAPSLTTEDGSPNPERVVLHRYGGMSDVDQREMLRQLTFDTEEFLALKPSEQIREVGRRIVRLDAVEDFLILIESGRALKLSGMMRRMAMAQKRSAELLVQLVAIADGVADGMAELSELLENEESK